MRIISGTCRGRKLATIKGMSIRPTADRVRESIFNIIGQQRLQGSYVLDLFAGTGAFGIECLSRGAASSVFVDIGKASCSVIRQNIELCGFVNQSVVLQHDAVKFNLTENIILKQSNITSKQPDIDSKTNRETQKFNLVFADPPYERGFVEKILKNRALLHSLSGESLLIIEHSLKEKIPDDLEKLDIHDQRQYGKTLISFLNKIADVV